MKVKILHIVGARPNFMKIAPIMAEMARYTDRFEQVLVHTGQHYNDCFRIDAYKRAARPRAGRR